MMLMMTTIVTPTGLASRNKATADGRWHFFYVISIYDGLLHNIIVLGPERKSQKTKRNDCRKGALACRAQQQAEFSRKKASRRKANEEPVLCLLAAAAAALLLGERTNETSEQSDVEMCISNKRRRRLAHNSKSK